MDVILTTPGANAVLKGDVSITVVASALKGIKEVRLYVDGVRSALAVDSAPYVINLDTTSISNGAHKFTAQVTDLENKVKVSNAVSVSVDNSVGILVPDTTAPTVNIASPVAASMVSGTITLSANAIDNVGVSGIVFLVDNVAFGVEDTVAPFSATLNTVTLMNGSHTISARARDAAGNMGLAPVVTVMVSNVATPGLQPTFTAISAAILIPKCATCHGAVGAPAGLSYNNYANTLASVAKGSPQTSLMYNSVFFGSMPLGGAKLNADELKAISDWITAGALNN